MTRIVGLDLSLVSTGVAVADGTTSTIRPRHVDPRGARLNSLGTDLWQLLEPERPHVAIVEGYALSGGRFPLGFARRAEWVGCVLRDLRRMQCHVVEITPSSLKNYATHNGNADKAAMIQAALDAGGDPANDDEADAYLLWSFGQLVVNGRDLFNEPTDVARRLRLADALWWPTPEELAHAG